MIVILKKTPPPKECESCERFIVGKCVIGENDKLPNNCPLADLTRKNADVVKRNKGEWLITSAFPHHVYCSCCHKTYIPNDRWQIWVDGDLPRDYCPNCGAQMSEEVSE